MKTFTRLLWLVLFALISLNSIHGQWVRTLDTAFVRAFGVAATNVFAGTGWGVFRSTNNGSTWTAAGLAGGAWSLAVSGANLFAGNFGIYHSTNNGVNWTEVGAPFPSPSYWSLAASGLYTFAYSSGHLFRSSNNGTSWTAIDPSTNMAVISLAVSGTNLLAGCAQYGIFLSNNNGTNWITVDSGGPGRGYVDLVAISGTNLFAEKHWGVGLHTLHVSSDNGSNWSSIEGTIQWEWFDCLVAYGEGLLAVSPYRIFRVARIGSDWTIGCIDSLAPASMQYERTLAVVDTSLLLGNVEGVWRRPLSEMITSVERVSSNLPTHYHLAQNYPNPVNPATTISFNLPSQSFASLKVFDVPGRDVATILSEELPVGTHSRQWDAAGMASGVYFYRLQAGSFTETKKLMLLR